jgi:hypothetical protein
LAIFNLPSMPMYDCIQWLHLLVLQIISLLLLILSCFCFLLFDTFSCLNNSQYSLYSWNSGLWWYTFRLFYHVTHRYIKFTEYLCKNHSTMATWLFRVTVVWASPESWCFTARNPVFRILRLKDLFY